MYRVTKSWLVEADGVGEALAETLKRGPDGVGVVPAPQHRYGTVQWLQPMDNLNAAWDLYMDVSVPVHDDPRWPYRPPTLVELSLMGLTTQQLSMLFDVSITGYRRQVSR